MRSVQVVCNINLCVGDDYGDNVTTFHCQLTQGHAGLHREEFDLGTQNRPNRVLVTWERADED